MEVVPPELQEVVDAQAGVDEARRILNEQSDRRNRAFAAAAAKGHKHSDLARMTGLTRQAVWKAIRDGGKE